MKTFKIVQVFFSPKVIADARVVGSLCLAPQALQSATAATVAPCPLAESSNHILVGGFKKTARQLCRSRITNTAQVQTV